MDVEKKELRGDGAKDSDNFKRSAGRPKDFRDLDRDRQRRAKESREASERRRHGTGVARAAELLQYLEVRASEMLPRTFVTHGLTKALPPTPAYQGLLHAARVHRGTRS